jgi:hypothetical protein
MSIVETVEQHFQKIDNAVFGFWEDSVREKPPTRVKGLIEQVEGIKLLLKRVATYGACGGFILVLHALGVPTEQVFHFIEVFLGVLH